MDVHGLVKEELQYELRVRAKTWEHQTVEQMRERLRKVAQREDVHTSLYPRYLPNLPTEVTECARILTRLEGEVTSVGSPRRYRALYLHVLARLRALYTYYEGTADPVEPTLGGEVRKQMRRLQEARLVAVDSHPLLGLPPLEYTPVAGLSVHATIPTLADEDTTDEEGPTPSAPQSPAVPALAPIGRGASFSLVAGASAPLASLSLRAPGSNVSTRPVAPLTALPLTALPGHVPRAPAPMQPEPALRAVSEENEVIRRTDRLLSQINQLPRMPLSASTPYFPMKPQGVVAQENVETPIRAPPTYHGHTVRNQVVPQGQQPPEPQDNAVEFERLQEELVRVRRQNAELTLRLADAAAAAAGADATNASQSQVDLELIRLRRMIEELQTQASLNSSSRTSSTGRGLKGAQIYKWGIKYSGLKTENLFSFLEKVSDSAKAREVSDADLFTGAADLFGGVALVWYRSGLGRGQFTSWSELQKELKATFLPKDWEDLLLDEIRERLQGSNESIDIYVAVMTKMFARLDRPPTPQYQLRIIWKNLHSFYLNRIDLESLRDVDELLDKGRTLEYARQVAEARKAADRPTLIDEDLAAKPKKRFDPKVAAVETGAGETPPPRVCWNCRKEADHQARDCPEPKTRHCYKCGRPDVLTRNCPKCSKN